MPQPAPQPGAPRAGALTCLIIEDNEFDSARLTRILGKSKLNMRVLVASTLSRARKTIERERPALILLDNNLPDGLGADFAIELSEDPTLADTPVIMVSDWPSPFMWEKAAMAGVRYVLSKMEFDTRYVYASLEPRKTAAR